MAHRLEKVAHLIKEEISLIFLQKLQDPKLGLMTITSVKVTPDLKIARIYVSIYEKDKRETVMKKLDDLKGIIRSKLAGRINLKFVPELNFYLDDTLDYVEKMEGIFKKIREDDIEKSE